MNQPPILTIELAAAFRWEQHRPGGCRCLCGLLHQEATPGATGCTAAGEPGLLIRATPAEQGSPLPVCLSCYEVLAYKYA
ncbi:hypothetical protein FCH28_37520 [Streptomyces piniterrae]|uniref:Uncharacterized protein n=1 Tax=Streptomyces piniterrae TaxID=2571125 RepID=A0A4U0MKS9_9ACTN|nr:DUF6372 family protein [Streptomyces piniterrae]TJZ41189.1 hypothetical protein FCH28_37520 [Streptomyces piniterrae]